jgi:hypothetical protein
VALFYRESDYFSIESTWTWGPNVISFVLRTGERRFGCVVGYIPPNCSDTQEFINQALEYLPTGIPSLLMGDINANLESPRDTREVAILALVATYGLFDVLPHYRQRRCQFGHGVTWWQHREDGNVTLRCDYLLALDRRFIRNVQILKPRLHTSEYIMVLGVLQSEPPEAHQQHMQGRKQFPLAPPVGPAMRVDSLLDTTMNHIAKGMPAVRAPRAPWISDGTWRVGDKLADASPAQSNRSEAFDVGFESLLPGGLLPGESTSADPRGRGGHRSFLRQKDAENPGRLQEAWDLLKGWYRSASDQLVKPSWMELERVTAEYEALYAKTDPPPRGTHSHPSCSGTHSG